MLQVRQGSWVKNVLPLLEENLSAVETLGTVAGGGGQTFAAEFGWRLTQDVLSMRWRFHPGIKEIDREGLVSVRRNGRAVRLDTVDFLLSVSPRVERRPGFVANSENQRDILGSKSIREPDKF